MRRMRLTRWTFLEKDLICPSMVESEKLNKTGTGSRARLPQWLRNQLPNTSIFAQTRNLLQHAQLHTVCESAKCPNHWECWSSGTATFMIGGDRCTRACKFCAIDTAKPLPLDKAEPRRIAEAVKSMKLRHAVITAVARDDLKDGGAEHFFETIQTIRRLNPGVTIEVLTPDFNQDRDAISRVLEAKPDIFNHNLETVVRLTPRVRSRATYIGSLNVLQIARELDTNIMTKSGLMLGLGETHEEVIQSLRDLRSVGCDLLTLGQYLQPTLNQLPVEEYIRPEQFVEFGKQARQMGFRHVFSAPRVRSSYHAEKMEI